MTSVGIFDAHLVTGKFSGGGLFNAQTLLEFFPKKYSVVYFPKTRTYYDIVSNINLLDNISEIESTGMKFSKTFKRMWKGSTYGSFSRYRRELLKGYMTEIKELDFVYDNDFDNFGPFPGIRPDIVEICRRNVGNKFGITLRGYSLINNQNNLKLLSHMLPYHLRAKLDLDTIKRYAYLYLHPFYVKRTNKEVSKCENINFIACVSPHLSFWNSDMSRDKTKFKFLFPSDITQFAKNLNEVPIKNNSIFYYSRLVPEKGIFELPKIISNILNSVSDVSVNIAGKFSYRKDESIFLDLLDKYQIKERVKVLGFLNEVELQKKLSESKVLLYPSHSDSFSISMLNSLHLKTKVVAYDLPSLTEIYGNLPTVKFVKEYDTGAMAQEAINILNESTELYINSFQLPVMVKFLKLTSEPLEVFNAISKLIDESLHN